MEYGDVSHVPWPFQGRTAFLCLRVLPGAGPVDGPEAPECSPGRAQDGDVKPGGVWPAPAIGRRYEPR